VYTENAVRIDLAEESLTEFVRAGFTTIVPLIVLPLILQWLSLPQTQSG